MDPRHPVEFSVEYPDRSLNRVTTFFRAFTAIPIMIVLAGVTGGYSGTSAVESSGTTIAISTGWLLFIPPLLMILFRQKYPRWWYDWNIELMRFSARITIYLSLMDDRYPSTDEQQSVRLDFPHPDAQRELNRWLPLVKWFLASPHYIVCWHSSTSPRSSSSSQRGSRSSSPVASRAACSTSSSVSSAERSACWDTPSCSSRTAIHPSR